MFYQQLYKLLAAVRIPAPDLAKVMIHIGVTGGLKVVYENKELRVISKIK